MSGEWGIVKSIGNRITKVLAGVDATKSPWFSMGMGVNNTYKRFNCTVLVLYFKVLFVNKSLLFFLNMFLPALLKVISN
jgi:hypothetical protein